MNHTSPRLNGKHVAVLVADGFEQHALTHSLRNLRDKGARIEVVSCRGKAVRAWDRDHWGATVLANRRLREVKSDDYDALLLPTGGIDPDALQNDARALFFILDFFRDGKPVGTLEEEDEAEAAEPKIVPYTDLRLPMEWEPQFRAA